LKLKDFPLFQQKRRLVFGRNKKTAIFAVRILDRKQDKINRDETYISAIEQKKKE